MTSHTIFNNIVEMELVEDSDGADKILWPLQWLAIHGVLICTTNCFQTDLETLNKIGGIPIMKETKKSGAG